MKVKEKILFFSLCSGLLVGLCVPSAVCADEVYYRYIPDSGAYEGYDDLEKAYVYFPESELEERKKTGYRIEKVPNYKPPSAPASSSLRSSTPGQTPVPASSASALQQQDDFLEDYSDALNLEKQGHAGSVKFYQLNDSQWVENCMNLGADIDKFGVKIAAYRIQWPGGKWSGWYVPGVNDLYKKKGEPMRRYWAYFNDHNFEIIYISSQKVNWPERNLNAVVEK